MGPLAFLAGAQAAAGALHNGTLDPIENRRFLFMKRVVITGVGAVTPVGIGKEEVWKNYEP